MADVWQELNRRADDRVSVQNNENVVLLSGNKLVRYVKHPCPKAKIFVKKCTEM